MTVEGLRKDKDGLYQTVQEMLVSVFDTESSSIEDAVDALASIPAASKAFTACADMQYQNTESGQSCASKGWKVDHCIVLCMWQEEFYSDVNWVMYSRDKAKIRPYLPLLKIMMQAFAECSEWLTSGLLSRKDGEDLDGVRDEDGKLILAKDYRTAPTDFVAFSMPGAAFEPEDGMGSWGYMRLTIDCEATPVRAVKLYELNDPMDEREVLLFPGQQDLVVAAIKDLDLRKEEPWRTFMSSTSKKVLRVVSLEPQPCTGGPETGCIHPRR